MEGTTTDRTGTRYPAVFAALAAPFTNGEVRTRAQNGRDLFYITARAAQNRLDEVLGPEAWQDDYVSFGTGAVKCVLKVTLPGGEVVVKTGVGGTTEMHDSSDTDKTGESDAFKRACVKFGVARYLYRDGVPDFARDQFHGADAAAAAPAPRDGGGYQGGGARAQGGPAPRNDPPRPQPQGSEGGGGNGHQGPPRSGKALFAWTKDQEQRYEVGLVKYLNQFMKLQDFPGRMVDLDPEQVRICYEEASRKLQSVGAGGRDPGMEG